ncbi:hypothetical protein F511_45951 [Dorcoceras hygrometricum]|uniref:Uncharacterized protein n=1 Tax=Dorcoceras hygrometricum TaxID=472368 RepID=A0A2Z7A1S2_9LAMI|nr:hypothetical protein F511_45951 [Dorcoceras hygrometricum]
MIARRRAGRWLVYAPLSAQASIVADVLAAARAQDVARLVVAMRKHWPGGGRQWAAGHANGCAIIGATCAMLRARRGGARPCAARMHGGGGRRRAACSRQRCDG